MLRARHRDLRSDFLLVKSPETQALVPFRDVIQVDGIMVRDREARLAKLFLTRIGRRDGAGGAHPRGRRALQPRQHAQHARQSGARARRPAAVVSAAVSFLARRRKTGPSARRAGRGLQGSGIAGDDPRRGRARFVGARPPLDRQRDRPRAQDRAAGRTAGRPRDRHDDVSGRGANRASPCRWKCASSTPFRTATASTPSRTTAASAGSTSARTRTSTHRSRDDQRSVDRHDVRRAAARALHHGQRVGRNGTQRRRDAARRRDHAAVPARPERSDAAGMADGDGHVAEPVHRLRTALPGREHHVTSTCRSSSRS